MEKTESEKYIIELFKNTEELYSLLWWENLDSKILNAHSFIINGKDSIPIFESEEYAKQQLAGSGYEKSLVKIKSSLLADVLQGMTYGILDPASSSPKSFRTCVVKQYAENPE